MTAKPRYRVTLAGHPIDSPTHFGEWFNGISAVQMAIRHAKWMRAETAQPYTVWDLWDNRAVVTFDYPEDV